MEVSISEVSYERFSAAENSEQSNSKGDGRRRRLHPLLIVEYLKQTERQAMETFVDDLVIKARKPYTITKQRERWTEEEHNRFLEALKLHGRAWQRIEEHIGTKTAVQIRSHAQKFFSKLEKEAVSKGVSLGHTLEIDIPPPRPKRKPSYPYPRNSAGVSSSSTVAIKDGNSLTKASSHSHGKETPDMENDSFSETPAGTETCAREQETLDDKNCSEVTMLFQEPSCVSVPSATKISIPKSAIPTNTCIFREFVHSRKEKSDKTATDESYMTVEPKQYQKLGKTDNNFMDLDNGTRKATKLENSCHNSQGKVIPEDRKNKLNLPENPGLLSTDEIQANESYPRHVPVHIVDGSSGACIQTDSPDICPSSIIYHVGGTHGNPYLFTNPAASATTEHRSNSSSSSVHQSMPNFPPCNPALHNQDACRSFLNVSHTFPSLLMSTLLQNPTAHMAATLAASSWPYTNGETSVDSSAGPVGGFPLSHTSASQNLVGIAAATVAAATAWWAAHGLLPLCPPIHPGFTVALPPTTATPMDISHVPVLNKDGEDRTPKYPPSEVKQLDPEFCEAAKPQHSTSKQPTLSSSDSTESEGARSNSTKLTPAGNEQKPELVIGPNDDATKIKVREKVDRSSCGSNTTSSSEVETDALEKQEKDKEEPEEPDASQQAGDPNNRRGRSATNLNESWKEVSQEGRLAFQALFSREFLPQSFSPPHDLKNNTGQPKTTNIEGNQNLDKKDGEDLLCLDLNHKSWGTYPCHPSMEKSMNQNEEKSLLSAELGHGKFKAQRTGFKPYKRCSVEAKESRVTNGGEEKGPKRLRLEEAAST